MDDHARAISDGIFLKRDGRPDRQSERRLEGSRDLGAYGGDMTWHIEGARHKEQVLKFQLRPSPLDD